MSIFRALALTGMNRENRDVLDGFGDLLFRGLCECGVFSAETGPFAALDLRGAAEDLRATAKDLQEVINACEPQNETERELFVLFPRYIRRLKALAAEMERSAKV